MKIRKIVICFYIVLAIALCTLLVFILKDKQRIASKQTEPDIKFDIQIVHSTVDFNNNNVDDYTDFLIGAKTEAKKHPKYDTSYFDGGYPPDNIGVCTDVIWRAFKNAGYSLRDMVDKDILANPKKYTKVTQRDNNIDFRRVGNLLVFFDSYALSMTVDINDIKEWQPGDIVIFRGDKHIGMISDKRNSIGQPYIIHNAGQNNFEEDYINNEEITGHYRFDASQIDKNFLVKWTD